MCDAGEADSIEFLDRVSENFEKPPNFTVLTFAQAKKYILWIFVREGYFRRTRNLSVADVDAAIGDLLRIRFGERVVESDLIFALDLVTWMRKPVREIAIICEQQHACRIAIESPNRVDTFVRLHVIEDGGAILLITCRSDGILRLVQ